MSWKYCPWSGQRLNEQAFGVSLAEFTRYSEMPSGDSVSLCVVVGGAWSVGSSRF